MNSSLQSLAPWESALHRPGASAAGASRTCRNRRCARRPHNYRFAVCDKHSPRNVRAPNALSVREWRATGLPKAAPDAGILKKRFLSGRTCLFANNPVCSRCKRPCPPRAWSPQCDSTTSDRLWWSRLLYIERNFEMCQCWWEPLRFSHYQNPTSFYPWSFPTRFSHPWVCRNVRNWL